MIAGGKTRYHFAAQAQATMRYLPSRDEPIRPTSNAHDIPHIFVSPMPGAYELSLMRTAQPTAR